MELRKVSDYQQKPIEGERKSNPSPNRDLEKSDISSLDMNQGVAELRQSQTVLQKDKDQHIVDEAAYDIISNGDLER